MAHSHDAAGAVIRDRLNGDVPTVTMVLGSGLGAVADLIEDPTVIDYADLPGFPRPTVSGHAGRIVSGNLASAPVMILQGRAHAYEGHAMADLALPARALRSAGVETLVLTNAAGGLREDLMPGRLMLITDHINWSGMSPLIGPNNDAIGPRFLDMSAAYDPDLRAALQRSADKAGIDLAEGVYLWVPGPNFETPAEIRAFRILGADAVGMSTVPEMLAARHCGLRVAAVSGITNLAAGMVEGAALDHAHTLVQSGALAGDMGRLLAGFLAELGAVGS
ncbi:MAG: purine-nucleoside phosphorylase [Alphaproteobacteria bacterium]|jgi:inosine/guanosine/xanthosine phosphorylase family protein|nr:purine-nucleoside phosphorylase [Alphaproteobacteria bacterium]